MGMGVIYICKKCKREKEILYGVGFSDFGYQDNNFKKLIEKGREEQLQNMNQLRKFLKLENVSLKDNYKHDAYICTKCKNIHNKFRYTLIAKNKIFTPKYKCNYCGSELRPKKEHEDFTITCDRCGSIKFEKESKLMMWD